MNGLCLFSRRLGQSLCRSARRRAERDPLIEIFEKVHYALHDRGLARAGSARDYLHAVFHRGAHGFDLIGVQNKPRFLFELCNLEIGVDPEIGGFRLQPDKTFGYALFRVVVVAREYGDALARVVSDQVA